MWNRVSTDIRNTDRVSFFVGGKRFPQLSSGEILRHDAGHVNNALSKISLLTGAGLHGEQLDRLLLEFEVVPDLWIYGFQLVAAYSHDPASAYAESAGTKIHDMCGVSDERDLASLQAKLDLILLPASVWSGGVIELTSLLEYERFALAGHAISLTRIADQYDHGVDVPGSRIAFTAGGRLMLAAIRLGYVAGVDIAVATSRRLIQIRDKYGVAE